MGNPARDVDRSVVAVEGPMVEVEVEVVARPVGGDSFSDDVEHAAVSAMRPTTSTRITHGRENGPRCPSSPRWRRTRRRYTPVGFREAGQADARPGVVRVWRHQIRVIGAIERLITRISRRQLRGPLEEVEHRPTDGAAVREAAAMTGAGNLDVLAVRYRLGDFAIQRRRDVAVLREGNDHARHLHAGERLQPVDAVGGARMVGAFAHAVVEHVAHRAL